MKTASFVFCFLLLASQAMAFEEFPGKTFTKCMEDSKGGTRSMADCMHDESARLTEIYDSEYKKALTKSPNKEKFEATEQAWEKSVDGGAEYVGNFYKGGSLENITYADFQIKERSRHIVFLQRLDSLETLKTSGVSLDKLKKEAMPESLNRAKQTVIEEIGEDEQKEQLALLEASQAEWLKYVELTSAYIKEAYNDKAAENWLINEYEDRAGFLVGTGM